MARSFAPLLAQIRILPIFRGECNTSKIFILCHHCGAQTLEGSWISVLPTTEPSVPPELVPYLLTPNTLLWGSML